MLRIRLLGSALAAGAVVAVAASAASPALAAAAPLSPSSGPAYTHWAAAQRAAGFRLLRPGPTLGLKPIGQIIVVPCHPGPNPGHKRTVFAEYIRTRKAQPQLLAIIQTNAASYCSGKLPGHRIGSYRIHRATARLFGVCGRGHQPRCDSPRGLRYLAWTTGRVLHLAASVNMWRSSLLRFARGLHPVS